MSKRLAPLVAGPPLDRGGRRPGGGWARSWTVGMSLLLHMLLLAALLTIARRSEDLNQAVPPSYQLMFESPGNNAPPAVTGRLDTAPPPTPELTTPPAAPPPPPAPPVDDAIPGPMSPSPVAPPTPNAPVAPPVQPPPPASSEAPTQTAPSPESALPVPQPVPAPPAAPPTQAPPAPAPPADAAVTPEPAPLPPPASPPQVRLEVPQPEAPPPPLVPDLVLPTPPMPPPPPVPQRPRTAPPPRALAGTFGNPMDLNFGPSASRVPAARVGAPRGSVASRSVDLSPGAPKGPNRAEAFFDARAARLGTDWQEALKTYWFNHRYYPQQAADDGEDGTVDLELTVASTGRVQAAVLKSRSGSQFIDMAAVGTWRNAQLPPLPPELGEHYTFTITINYILLR